MQWSRVCWDRGWRQTVMNRIMERCISKHGGETTEWLMELTSQVLLTLLTAVLVVGLS